MSDLRRLAVVIPCYHDEAPLARLLPQLRANAEAVGVAVRLVVVDGAASEACRAVCAQYAAQWIDAEPCRGRQLRQGAQACAADALWFLHADANLVGTPLAAVVDALRQGVPGGYFRFRFAGARPWPARLLEPAINSRCRVGVPYGDQGLFACAEAYWRADGHAPWPLFEEVPLVRGLRRQGRLACLGEGLEVDPRRWQRDGWWRRTLTNRALAGGFALGVDPDRLARWYTGARR